MRRARRLGGVTSALLAVALLVPAGAVGQDGSLDRVAELAGEGRVDEARSALLEWWDAGWDAASERERQRGLWLRGTLTVDPSMAGRDFTRLVLEHPGGPHSAAALLRLAQAASVEGRPVAAARHYERLLREYPDRPERLTARRWLDENRDEVARARARLASSSDSEAESGAPREPAPAGSVTVQLGAFSSVERARALLRSVRSEGVDGLRLARVSGSDLVRVRAGRFPTRVAASDLRERLEERGFDAAVVTDADREDPIP